VVVHYRISTVSGVKDDCFYSFSIKKSEIESNGYLKVFNEEINKQKYSFSLREESKSRVAGIKVKGFQILEKKP